MIDPSKLGDLHEALGDYAALYAKTYGRDEPVTELIPASLPHSLKATEALRETGRSAVMTHGIDRQADAVVIEPLTVCISTGVQLTGISRSRLYELIQSGDLQTVKVGSIHADPI